jgi:malate dehydrogenase (oxaloacetate-decarboxylating)(NADP+)
MCATSSACAPARTLAAMNALMLEKHTLFITDTFVNEEPERRGTGRDRAMAAARCAASACRPRWPSCRTRCSAPAPALGAAHARGAQRCSRARPGIECDGEMQGDAALSEEMRRGYLPETTLDGEANLLVLPNLDAANILFNVLKMTGGHGVTVGPVLLGAPPGAHPDAQATVRRIVNMTALAVADVLLRGGPRRGNRS